MSSWYIDNIEPFTAKLYKSIVPFMNLDSAKKIAEVGCGPGNGVKILLENTTEAEIYASDLGDVRASLELY